MSFFKKLQAAFDTKDESIIMAGNRNILLPICVWPGGKKPSTAVVLTSIVICASHYFLLVPLVREIQTLFVYS